MIIFKFNFYLFLNRDDRCHIEKVIFLLSAGNAGLCRQLPHSASLRDVAWASTSCTLTFETIGIWPEGADGTDVNCCDRAHVAPLLASADDFGKVKLYAFPTSQPKVITKSCDRKVFIVTL